MKSRTISTIALWALFILLPIAFGHWGLFLLITVFGFGTIWEMHQLSEKAGLQPDKWVAKIVFVILMVALSVCPPWTIPPLAFLSIGFVVVTVGTLIRAPLAGFLPRGSLTLFLYLFATIPFGLMIVLIHDFGLFLPAWVLAVAKFSDVGALLVGSAIGKHKMSPTLSPNKTWEGLAGGLACSVIVSLVFAFLFKAQLPVNFSWIHAAWMSIPIAAAAVLSDLAESAIKREAGVKDSGNLIPGIGGCFDLTDSLLLAYPTAFFLIWAVL